MANPPRSADDRYIVPAVEQAARVLICLADAEAPHMSLTEICAAVGIHKSKAFSILLTLNKFGIIRRDGAKKGYSLGPRLVSLSRRFLSNLDSRNLAEPILQQLAIEGDGTASFGIIDGDEVFIAAKSEGVKKYGIVSNFIGQRFPITHGSAGKAIAAELTDDALGRLLERDDLYFYGDPAKFDKARLFDDLAQCRREGYASDTGDVVPKINAVAAAVRGTNQAPTGYIILFGLFDKDRLKDLGPLVAQGAKKLSVQMGYSS